MKDILDKWSRTGEFLNVQTSDFLEVMLAAQKDGDTAETALGMCCQLYKDIPPPPDIIYLTYGTPEWTVVDEKIKNLESWEGDMRRSVSTDKLYAEEPVLVCRVEVVLRKDAQDTKTRAYRTLHALCMPVASADIHMEHTCDRPPLIHVQ